jgi:hypothetical protein
VTWQLPAAAGKAGKAAGAPASLAMTYQLTIVRQSGSWDVRTIGALAYPQSPGPP